MEDVTNFNTVLTIFTPQQREKAEYILNDPHSKLSDLLSHELKDLAIVWCYYSSKIEGNTYTYVETEALLKDNITSEKRYEDAKMIKNLYNTFIGELRYIHQENHIEVIDEKTLYRVHKSISADLISKEDEGVIRNRAVRISGTEYTPPRSMIEIKLELANILTTQEQIKNPLERAVYLHCNLARLQPFIDGNKRTARVMESIVLMNAGIIPIYSISDSDILRYRRGLIAFYESGDYTTYADYFLDKQIERLKSIA